MDEEFILTTELVIPDATLWLAPDVPPEEPVDPEPEPEPDDPEPEPAPE